ncbi:Fis family transcriptional regulator [Actinomyces sp. MRS3W]|uniref:Fis family transcriptional regulator n=1 Tax=Actinomyces sp. MRS3W TaxID=2800796 RepID=UPI0028FDC3CC|nr:Fis family transcriptional regulator [Actinomyces sp. MRS3W]MDU0349824.1 Fis family transcriptional regulator [Actinomyces sp. MRS3W]
MNWDSLLADLESSFEAERRADVAAQAADLAEAEIAGLHLVDRLRGAVGRPVHVRTRGGVAVDGVVKRVEDAFALLDEGEGIESLVPVAAIVLASPLPGPAPTPTVRRRPGIQVALRGLARSGTRVRVVFAQGEATGRIVRVGADYLDLARDGVVTGPGASGTVTIALEAIEVVRSR